MPRGIRVRRLAGTAAELPALRTVTALKLQLSFTLSSCFHTYLPSPFFPLFSLPPSPTLSFSFSPSPFLSDGSITGAMLRELLQPSLSGCVSSNVGVEPCNLLTMQEKGKERRGGKKKKSLRSPNDARREPSCAKFRRVVLPCFSVSWPPDSDLQTEPYWAFLHGGVQAAVFSRKQK